jgi:hypothetical protein
MRIVLDSDILVRAAWKADGLASRLLRSIIESQHRGSRVCESSRRGCEDSANQQCRPGGAGRRGLAYTTVLPRVFGCTDCFLAVLKGPEIPTARDARPTKSSRTARTRMVSSVALLEACTPECPLLQMGRQER